MISYLRMENFRRHANTELRFDGAGQIVLIAGPNGAGKSSIIEAIVFALYGNSRSGNRWLDRMIRRGGELEGMEVELEFDVAGVKYQVKRRLDNHMTSAVLYGNDTALTEGSREVTAEVSRIFGMDAKGFKLAVVAQQKELDGLASMKPAERSAMLSRLLRLDAITAAKDLARTRYRGELAALRGLGSVEGLEETDLAIAKLQDQIDDGEEAVKDTEMALTLIDAELAAGAGLEAQYSEASQLAARAEGALASARGECDRAARELSRLEVVEVDISGIDLEDLSSRAASLTQRIADGEAAKAMASQATAVGREIEGVQKRLGELRDYWSEEDLDGPGAQQGLEVAEELVVAAQGTVNRVSEERARATALLKEVASAVARTETLGATCDECGQSVSDEHKHDQLTKYQERSAVLSRELADADVADAQAELTLANNALRDAKAHQAAVAQARRDQAERSDLERRLSTYQGQLERLKAPEVDLAALYEERASVETALVVARNLLDQYKVAEMMKERRDQAMVTWRESVLRREEAASDLESAAVDTDLVAAHDRMKEQHEARVVEQAVLASLREDLARRKERLIGLMRDRVRIVGQEGRRRELETSGVVASLTGEVLDKVGQKLNQQIRPQLEGGIADILARMSDGRFDAVRLDEAYALSVRDDGQFRPLVEFSGGEMDLIALSVRLALASVVSDRHGFGGVGFLILDECFGSQDHERQGSIMSALRGLRGPYGQILLISHVGGLEDGADVVVEVGIDEITGLATAQLI
jgi:exonuclease SbcC